MIIKAKRAIAGTRLSTTSGMREIIEVIWSGGGNAVSIRIQDPAVIGGEAWLRYAPETTIEVK